MAIAASSGQLLIQSMSRSDHAHALAQKLPQVVRNWQRLADAALVEFRISSSAGWCLVHLDRLGSGARQTDLAEQLGITQPSLVRTLHQLEATGLVERLSHPQDRRANRLALLGRLKAQFTAIADIARL